MRNLNSPRSQQETRLQAERDHELRIISHGHKHLCPNGCLVPVRAGRKIVGCSNCLPRKELFPINYQRALLPKSA